MSIISGIGSGISKVGGSINKLGSTISKGVDSLISTSVNTNKISINKHIDEFKGVGREGNIELGNNNNLLLEDPTFLVFDINIDDSDGTPFFKYTKTTASDLNTETSFYESGPIIDFLNRYSVNDYEMRDVIPLYREFVEKFKLIFPCKNDRNSGSKRHYINSISGLGILNKTIINYPEDKITIKMSEDITMLLQYISELYLNLTYSFASNRQLIPSNLLKFDMYITISDVRDFKDGMKSSGTGFFDGKYVDKLSENRSKFIYKLHDCELNFFNSKNHSAEITVGGFGEGASKTPSDMEVTINFKSSSRILSSALIDTSYLLDYRTKEILPGVTDLTNPTQLHSKGGDNKGHIYDDLYSQFNNDYKTQDEFAKTAKKTYLSGVDDSNTASIDDGTENYVSKLARQSLNQLKAAKSSLQMQLEEQTNRLVETGLKAASDAMGINLSVNKINVYYQTPIEKLERANMMVSNLANHVANDMNKMVSNLGKDAGDALWGRVPKDEQFNRTKNTDLGKMGQDIANDTKSEAVSLLTGRPIKATAPKNNVYNRVVDTNDNGINKHDGTKFNRTGDVVTTELNQNTYNDLKPNSLHNITEKQLLDSVHKNSSTNTTVEDKGNTKSNIYGLDIIKSYNRTGDIIPIDGKYNDLTPNSTYHIVDKKMTGVVIPSDEPSGFKVETTNLYDNKQVNVLDKNGKIIQTDKFTEEAPIVDNLYNLGQVHVTDEKGKVIATPTDEPSGFKIETKNIYDRPQVLLDGKGGMVKQPKKFTEKEENIPNTYDKKHVNVIDDEGNALNARLDNSVGFKPSTKNIYSDSKHLEKEVLSGRVQKDGQYNLNFPTGDVNPDGQYNINFPDGNVYKNNNKK